MRRIRKQKLYLAEHIRSIKSHIDGLSLKEYDNVEKSLDFVMLFVPIEPAFMTAIHFRSTTMELCVQKESSSSVLTTSSRPSRW
ncbi:MAG: DNA recombination protein RmuC [Saprospiraceae bacterium]|nr:DNA recombination protein RmuC [Candidatus Brachybacter algidus]